MDIWHFNLFQASPYCEANSDLSISCQEDVGCISDWGESLRTPDLIREIRNSQINQLGCTR
jgi:hypothetical protein